jgi:hypothetical protein
MLCLILVYVVYDRFGGLGGSKLIGFLQFKIGKLTLAYRTNSLTPNDLHRRSEPFKN